MIEFRRYRNTDPPHLIKIWNESFLGRGAIPLKSASIIEPCLFAKPYFDPDGFIIAVDDQTPVGFVHAGFGPEETENCLNYRDGIVCAVGVRPAFRRKGTGTALLQQAEQYLIKNGATTFTAGGVWPHAPFYLGLYGNSSLPGFLASDSAAAPFFEHHGYTGVSTTLVLELNLQRYQPPVDPRFVGLRRRFDVQLVPHPEINSWWLDAVFGPIEPVEFRLADRLSTIPAARILIWEMSSTRQPGFASAGILDISVRPDFRRQGLARFLISQMLRYLQEQFVRLVEVQIPQANSPALDLFRGLGFEQVDMGRSYQRAVTPSP